jgi:hypothetical protein
MFRIIAVLVAWLPFHLCSSELNRFSTCFEEIKGLYFIVGLRNNNYLVLRVNGIHRIFAAS